MPPKTNSTSMLPQEYRIMFEAENSHWWYRALRCWLKNVVCRYVPKTGMVLDAGCGTGATLALLHALNYKSVGLDLSFAGLQFACKRDRLFDKLCCASVADLPYPSRSFTGVISADVLYLLHDDQESLALREFKRVLQPGGVLILNLPAYQWLHGEHDQAVSTKRRYTAKSLQQKLRAAGFEPLRLEYRYMMFLPAIALVRLLLRRGKQDASDASSDLTLNFGLLNPLLTCLTHMEERFGRFIIRPFGTSVCAVAKVSR